jgi:predicted phage terminase large subunit-like protein
LDKPRHVQDGIEHLQIRQADIPPLARQAVFDQTLLGFGNFHLQSNHILISDGNLLVETLVEHARQWQPDALGVEDGQIWKALEAQFMKVCDEKRYWPSFEVLKPLSDKMVRAMPLRGRMQAGKVWFDKHAPWFEVLYKEFLQFPAGKHDDIIDALAWSVRLTLSRAAPRARELPPAASWKDKLALPGVYGASWLAA